MTPEPGSPLWITRRKWPDAPHYELEGVVLGDDECGIWLGSQAGVKFRLPNRDEITTEYPAVFCVPRHDWFLAHFWLGHPEVEIYVDICAPAEWSPEAVSVIDLDFDVIRWNAAKGGHAELVDEEEFEEHRITLRYPEELQASARKAAQEVLARVTRRDAPFNLEAAAPWVAAMSRSTRP